MRTPIIAGNWKMNLTLGQAIELVDGIGFGLPFPGEVEVIVAPPFLCLPGVVEHLRESYIGVAAQNFYFEDKGAFTGECSGKQVREAGADYVIIGHSERRQYFAETDETVNKKIKAATRNGLIPIVCVGETLEQRERDEVASVMGKQLAIGLMDLTVEEVAKLIIAYEPVWAIGTGLNASPQQAQEVHGFIRKTLGSMVSSPVDVPILYGGSVKPENSGLLLSQEDIDGVLVGGASLKVDSFSGIIAYA